MHGINISIEPYFQSFVESVDNYFYLKTETKADYLITALKVASYCTIVIPLLVLAIKGALWLGVKPNVKPGLVSEEGEERIPPPNPHQHYWGIGETVQEFLQNNQARIDRRNFLYPLDGYIVNPLSQIVTSSILTAWNWTFGQFDFDPVSTETLVSASGKIKALSLAHAKHRPTSLPVLGYFNRCSIVVARYLFVTSRDIHYALKIPEKLRQSVESVLKAKSQESVDALAKEALKTVENTEIQALSYWERAKAKLREKAVEAAHFAAGMAIDKAKNKAIETISAKEAVLRKEVVGIATRKFAHLGISFVARWGIRTAIIMSATTLASRAIGGDGSLIPEALPYITQVAGLALWARCLKPTMDRLYAAHTDDFQDEKSVFFGLFKDA